MTTQHPTPGTADVEGLAEHLSGVASEDEMILCRPWTELRSALSQAATALRDLRDERNAALKRHSQHLEHVQAWMCSMYAIMIDPCALDSEAPIEVLDACKQLESAALEQREQLATLATAEADNARLRKELSLARSLIVNAFPDPGDGTFDEVRLADLVRMVVGERDLHKEIYEMSYRNGSFWRNRALGAEARASALEVQVKGVKGALEPFTKVRLKGSWSDMSILARMDYEVLTVGDFRRARLALQFTALHGEGEKT